MKGPLDEFPTFPKIQHAETSTLHRPFALSGSLPAAYSTHVGPDQLVFDGSPQTIRAAKVWRRLIPLGKFS